MVFGDEPVVADGAVHQPGVNLDGRVPVGHPGLVSRRRHGGLETLVRVEDVGRRRIRDHFEERNVVALDDNLVLLDMEHRLDADRPVAHARIRRQFVSQRHNS